MIWFHYIIKKITTINLPYLKRKDDSDDLQEKEKTIFKRKKNYKVKFQDNPLLKEKKFEKQQKKKSLKPIKASMENS